MSGKMILKLASAGLLGATLIGTGTSAMAAPLGIAPKTAVTAPSQITDVQWRRWGGGWGYRRGWGGGWGWGAPAVGAAIGLGVLGAAAAASTAPYYYDYPAYGYGYPAYYGYPGYYYGYPY